MKPYLKKYYPLSLCLFISIVLIKTASYSQTGVLTQHNDLNRTGWNQTESILNTNNVRPGSFGKIFTRSADDQIYAQPLVVLNVIVPGNGNKNIVIVATVNNTVYAFDADSANVNNPYWQVNLTPPGSRAVKNTDMTRACGGNYKDFSGNMGIVGTPVIDSTTNTMYVVVRSVTPGPDSIFQQYLHAIDITTGDERNHSPVLITAQVAGNGDASVGGFINFNPQKQNQRAGLLLLNGIVYITWASHCDWAPYHGWVIGYDKTSLQQSIVYNTTPEGYNGGIWMSAAAPAADDAGNIYIAVGNGSVGVTNDPANPVNRSESALKLTTAGNTLAVSSFFTPQNYPYLESSDRDFGVAGMLLIPNTNRVITGCKDGNLYLLDRDNMGGFDSTRNHVVQTITLGSNVWILRSSLAYYKGEQKEFIYSWSEKALLHAFPYDRNADTLDVINAIISGVAGPKGGNGSFFSLSSNGSADSTAILWVNQAANGGNANQAVLPGVFRAFSATDVTKELWNSFMDSSDIPGNYAKFNCPAISNGKVYLATFSNKLMVYGLKSPGAGDTCNSVNLALNKPAVASSVAPGLDASKAFDGSSFTRWGSRSSDPQSIYVDLGARYDLCQVVLKWEVALGKDFQIQVSEDAVNWTTIKTITGNINYENYLHVQGSGRYVRMLGTARGTTFGYSIWEFEVYGKPGILCREPSDLTVSDIYANTATLHWNGYGAAKFNIQYKKVPDSSWTTVASDSSYITLPGLSCATDYLFRVQNVCNSTDSGNYSPSSGFSTLSCTQIIVSNQLCAGGNTVFALNIAGAIYQWQADTGSGFADIADNSNYTGTKTPNLHLNNLPSSWYGYQYRCMVDGVASNAVSLRFSTTWNGLADNTWENPANWSCGAVPDANTDVFINSGTVILNSNAMIRSINLSSGVNFTVNPGFIFTITH